MSSDNDTIKYTKCGNRCAEVTCDQFTMPLEELEKYWERRRNGHYVVQQENPHYSTFYCF